MKAELEYSDIKNVLPAITEHVRRELIAEMEKEDFIDYPKGLQMFLYKRISPDTYQKVYRLWTQPTFPRILEPKGVYLKELKQWQKNEHQNVSQRRRC